MTTKKKQSTQSHNFIIVTTTEIQAANTTDAIKISDKMGGLTNRVAILEIDDKGDGMGGIINEDFQAIVATVMG